MTKFLKIYKLIFISFKGIKIWKKTVWSEIKKTTLPILHYKNGLTGILFRNLAISDSPNLSYLYTTYLYRSIGVVHLELFPLLLFLLYLPSIRTKSKYCIEIWPKKISSSCRLPRAALSLASGSRNVHFFKSTHFSLCSLCT